MHAVRLYFLYKLVTWEFVILDRKVYVIQQHQMMKFAHFQEAIT